MRKSSLIILAVLIILAAVLVWLTQDFRLERVLEKAVQQVAGARVEIDNFHLSLFKLEGSWQRLQIADKKDPWKNIVETGPVSFDVEGRPLWWRRVIVREMLVENVRGATPRETDGSLPEKEQNSDSDPGIFTETVNQLKSKLADVPVLNIDELGKSLKIDSLIDVEKLTTTHQYRALSQDADSAYQDWQGRLDPADYRQKIAKLEKQIKKLDLDKVDNAVKAAAALKNLRQIYDASNTLKQEITSSFSVINAADSLFRNGLKDAQAALSADISRAQQLAKLKDLELRDVSLLLFGTPVVGSIEKWLGYVNLVRTYMPTAQKLTETEKKAKLERFQGQNIRFPFHYRYPQFLIRHIQLTGATAAGDTTSGYFIAGDIQAITNEPGLWGKPTLIDLNVSKISDRDYQLNAVLDHTLEIPRDTVQVRASSIPVGTIKLAQKSYLPQAVNIPAGDFSVKGMFVGEDVTLDMGFKTGSAQFDFPESQSKIAGIFKHVLANMHKLDLTAKTHHRAGDFRFQLASNVDTELAGALKGELRENLTKARADVSAYIQRESAVLAGTAETAV
ncbi:TIGR03545 family protein, partial [bacterium]|nr:TIGR03545 family protein [bacterium]